MSLQNLHNVYLSAQSECDAIIASSVQGVVSDAFKSEYSKKVKTVSSFSPYKEIRWLSGNAVVEFTTSRTNKRIFFPSVGFFVASKLVPLYRELLEYRNAVVAMLQANGTSIEDEEDNNGNVSQDAIQMVDAYAGFTASEKDWIKKFLSERKNSPVLWWGKGKEIKRANDFFVSPLMKCAKLNAETQGEIADVAKQLASDPTLYSLLASGPIVSNSGADILCEALKLFQQKRQSDWLAQGREVNSRLREYFDPLTEQSLDTMSEDQIGELFLGVKDATGQHVDLVTMWAGRNGNGWSNIDPKGVAQKVQKIRDYLVRLKHDTALASTFWAGADPDRPPGFGSSVVTELLMKFHPDEVLMYAKEGCGTLKQLGLIEFDAPNADNAKRAAEFKLVQAAGTIILAKMRAMNIDKFIKSDGAGDGTPADYMTVNEFLCFVKENFQEIQKEALKMNMTTVQPNPYDQTKGTKKVFGTSAEDRLMKRIVASLTTKPFVILAGHSGTGKSRMVKKLAYMTCRDNDLHAGKDPLNYCMIEVKPNWHDSTELLGYFSSFGGDHYVKKQLNDFIMRAYAYPNVPFFVCLDEMNLAPVEQYFAEFLSALEDVHVDEDKAKAFTDRNAANMPTLGAAKEVVKYSSAPLVKPIDYKENTALLAPATTQANDWLETHGLTIPKNLFVVGTVNMDESTNQFSRKVLDRAFTIEMTDASFEDFGDATKDPEPDFVKEDDTDHSLIDALLMGGKKAGALTKKTVPTDANEPNGQLENMNALKGILDGTPFVVAYRFANEYALYEAALNKIDADDQGNVSDAQKKANAKQAFDDVVLAKLLPRIAGETPMVKGLYMGTKKKDGTEEKPGLLSLLPYEGFPKEGEGTDTASGLKMKAILSRPNQPYLTFWP